MLVMMIVVDSKLEINLARDAIVISPNSIVMVARQTLC